MKNDIPLYLEQWFPTVIGYTYNPNHKKIEANLSDYCLSLKKEIEPGGKGWLSSNTYNTSDGQYDLLDDPAFSDLNKWIDTMVQAYVEQNKIKKPVTVKNSWFNIYKKYDYQEFHKHPESIISTIYFLKADKNSSRVVFKTPKDDMFNIKFSENSPENLELVYYTPEAGKLLIFPSNISHSVEQHLSDNTRITLAHNFGQSV